MRKKTFILLAIVCFTLMISMATFSTACSKTESTATTSTTASSEVFNLKWAVDFTADSDSGKMVGTLAKMIDEYTGGRVKIEVFYSETLGKSADQLDMLNGGVCDIASINVGTFANDLPMIVGLKQPMVVSNRAMAQNLAWELYYAGYFDKELAPYKVLSFWGTPACNFFFNSDVRTAADFKGQKIRAADPTILEFIEALGGTPVSMPGPDVFMALDRGTLDGATTGYEFAYAQKWYEITKYVSVTGMYGGCNEDLMNRDTWNSLPADVQLGVEQAIARYKYEFEYHFQDMDQAVSTLFAEKGCTVYEFSPDALADMRKSAQTVIDKWIATQEAKGLPAKAMIDRVWQIIDRYY